MKVHLIGSLRHFDDDILLLETIAHFVEEHGSIIAQKWFTGVKDRKNRGSRTESSLDWHDIVETNLSATVDSDVLIVEGSRFNYSQGFQTALALQNNKPVLNLYREDLPEYKEWPDKLFVSGISHPLFVNKSYKTEEDLSKIISEFLHEHSKKTEELDLKLILDRDDYKKIDNLSKRYGKSKAGLIKEILLKNLNET